MLQVVLDTKIPVYKQEKIHVTDRAITQSSVKFKLAS